MIILYRTIYLESYHFSWGMISTVQLPKEAQEAHPCNFQDVDYFA